MMTGIISVFLAVLPMGIAFAGGTPLQGSLGWGLSVINGGKSDTEDVHIFCNGHLLKKKKGDCPSPKVFDRYE